MPRPYWSIVKQAYAGRHGGRPVILAEYRYRPTGFPWSHRIIAISVAVVELRTPHPPQYGPGGPKSWVVAGTDLLTWRDGNLEIPAILPVVDQLRTVAAQLER